jgi:hypothetical protein
MSQEFIKALPSPRHQSPNPLQLHETKGVQVSCQLLGPAGLLRNSSKERKTQERKVRAELGARPAGLSFLSPTLYTLPNKSPQNSCAKFYAHFFTLVITATSPFP